MRYPQGFVQFDLPSVLFLVGAMTLAIGNDDVASRPKSDNEKLERNKALLRRAHSEVWSKGNMQAAEELYAEDFVCHFIDAIEWRGLKGLKQEVGSHRKSFPDWKEQVIQIVAEGPFVVTLFKSTGTHEGDFHGLAPTGRRIEIRELAIHRIADGKIVEQWGFPDVPTMEKQLRGESK